MTTKRPSSRLAASGQADDPSDQITKEHNDEDDANDDITVDPSGDVTVEATEDVTTEAASGTPPPSLRPGGFGEDGTPVPAVRAPTLLGVPIQSLPLPGVTSASPPSQDQNEDATRTIDYNEEITVLAPPAPGDPLAALDALDAFDRPSITDDDEEETKVEPAETAMKAAASIDDVTTALSAQASLEREKALRRTVSSSAPSDDLEFADPDAEDDEEEESLDDSLSDEDEVISAGAAIEDEDEEVISAGGAIEEEADDDDDDAASDGVATATFMKPADSTGLSGLLNPRRPPTGNPYGSRLPAPYSQAATAPAPSTSPFASRLGPAPTGTPYPGRLTNTPMTAIQIPPPSAEAVTASDPGFFTKRVPVPAYGLIALVGGIFVLGVGVGSAFSGRSAPPPPVVATKPAPALTAPVVVPVAGPTTPSAETKPVTTPVETAKPTPAVADLPKGDPIEPSGTEAESGLWKPATKKKPVHKAAALVDPLADDAAKPTPKPAVATTPKPKPAEPLVAATTPKPAVAATPKPAATKPAKKPAKVWVDPFAN